MINLKSISIILIVFSSIAFSQFVRVKDSAQKLEKPRKGKKIFQIPFPISIKISDVVEETRPGMILTGGDFYKDKIQQLEDRLKSHQNTKSISAGEGSKVLLVGIKKPDFAYGIGKVGAAIQGIKYGIQGAAAALGGKVGAIAGTMAGTVKGAVVGAYQGAVAGAAKGSGLVMAASSHFTQPLHTLSIPKPTTFDKKIVYHSYRPFPVLRKK